MEIIKVELDRVETLQSISKQTFVETFSDQNTQENLEMFLENNYSLDKLMTELNNPDSTFYFLFDENELQGYLKVNRRAAQTEFQGDDALEIERIYVRKQSKGKGYGKLLLDKAIQLSIEEKLPLLWLGVWENNVAAIRFYEKNGFIPFGEHIFLLGTDPQRDILMKLNSSK